MENYYSKYNTDESWLIREEGWVRSLQGVREAQFSLGNGFLGSRAVLEEIPYNACPGTYIAGIYDKIGSQVDELVNFPNPFNFKIIIDKEKLGVTTMDVLEHRRILNLRHGLLSRQTLYQDTKKRKYDYQSLRFLSMNNKNVGVMQVVLTPLDGDAQVSIHTEIDTNVCNTGLMGKENRKHFRVKEVKQFADERYLAVETLGKSHIIIYRSGFHCHIRKKKYRAKENVFEFTLKKGQTAVFTKVIYITAAENKHFKEVKEKSEKEFRKAFQNNFDYLLKKHIKKWETLWQKAEISIWGLEPEVEKNFRFNIYHMLICANENQGFSSIGAKALTGEGYLGHIFWDTEIFLLPFYIYTFPKIARSLLLYRYNRLDIARFIAKQRGYKGAMFPWESTGSGEEETPAWARNLTGRVTRIYTDKMEHHITADIAYAFCHYYLATGDEEFMQKYGYELLFETARFWASRVEYNKKKKRYEIKHIIGPDEFHEDVDNNAYTNMMAANNLLFSYQLFCQIKKRQPKIYSQLVNKINISLKEAEEWKQIAIGLSINIRKDKVIEQFDGFFKLKKVKIQEFDENFIPLAPKKIKIKDYKKTQLVKQADVLMLLYLLSENFDLEIKRKNYEYYVERTLHRSSLSPAIYALIAIEVGDMGRAYRYFNLALHTDISDVHGNTAQGVHAACIGGTWQILVNGFAGIRIKNGLLSIDPKIPHPWRKILLSLNWQGYLLRFEIKNDRIKIQAINARKQAKIPLIVFGALKELKGDKPVFFERKPVEKKIEQQYL